MLTEIKDRATGWIAWIIVIIISIPFTLWGVNEYFAGGSEINIALVNGQEIDQQSYRYALEERRSMARRVLGSQFDPDSVNSAEFKKAVLDDLILRRLLNEDAEKAGYRVGDEQLSRFIMTTPQFQREGEFDSAAYQQAVQGLGYTKVGFEDYLRQQNVLQQIQNGLENSAFITKQDEAQLLTLAEERRTFDYIVVKPEDFVDGIEISDEQLQAHYDENQDLYRTPEMIKVEYVSLAVADLGKDIEVSEEDIQRYFEDNKDRYKTPEQRVASHILITVDENADEAIVQDALRITQSLAERARAGEDFAELAKANSQDPGSAARGGDLGMIEPGVMVKPFEDVLFNMELGDISDPVKTRYGYHVIKLTELVPEKGKELSEVYSDIEQEERGRVAESLFVDRAETFRNIVFEQPDSLEPAVEELNLELQTSDWFSQSEGSGIADNAKIRDIAFSDDVYIENLNSEAIELDINTMVALRKIETRAASIKPLEEVREAIVQTLKQSAARDQALAKGDELLTKIQQSGNWESLLSDNALESTQAVQSRLQPDPQPSVRVTAEVFRTAAPAAEPVYGSASLFDGSYILFRLTDVESGNPATVDEGSRQEINESLNRRRGNEYFLSYQRGLRESAEIEIFEENM